MHRSLALGAFVLASLPALASAQPDSPDPAPEPAPAPAPAPAPSPSPSPSPSPAAAPAPDPAPASASYEEGHHRLPGPPRYDRFRFGIGGRAGYVDDAGFDAFAKNDVLGQLSLSGAYVVFNSRKLSLSVGGAWDVGTRASGARGLDTKLTVQRFTAPIEGRFHVTPWLHAFAKVAPGAAAYHARLQDPSAPDTLEDVQWVFATDVSAGASLLVAPHGAWTERRVRFWITPEVGYGFTSRASLRPIADREEEDVLGTDARSRLGSLATNGVFWRVTLAVTF